MAKIIELERYGQLLKLEVRPGYYPYNRTLQVGLYEDWESYGALTCNLDKPLERNCAYIDVNNMGEDIVEVLEKSGFGKRTGRKCQSGLAFIPSSSSVKKRFGNAQMIVMSGIIRGMISWREMKSTLVHAVANAGKNFTLF